MGVRDPRGCWGAGVLVCNLPIHSLIHSLCLEPPTLDGRCHPKNIPQRLPRPALPLSGWQGQAQRLAPSECRARPALLPSCWLHFGLKPNPGFGGAWGSACAQPCGRPQLGQGPSCFSKELSGAAGSSTQGRKLAGEVDFFPRHRPLPSVG